MDKRLLNYPLLALSFALAITLVCFFHPQWGYPCLPICDGPASAMYGFPLPFIADGMTSLSWEVMPLVLLINVILITAATYILLNVALPRRIKTHRHFKWLGYGLCGFAIAQSMLTVIWLVNNDWLGLRTNAVFFHGTHTGYFDLRPSTLPVLNPPICTRIPLAQTTSAAIE